MPPGSGREKSGYPLKGKFPNPSHPSRSYFQTPMLLHPTPTVDPFIYIEPAGGRKKEKIYFAWQGGDPVPIIKRISRAKGKR